MHQETFIGVITHSFLDTLPMIPILFILYFVLEYLWHEKGIDLLTWSKISGHLGPLAGTLLGIIPQCGMSVFMTSLFLSKRVSLGTLIATYLATSDEALPVLLAHGDRIESILYIIAAKFLLGIIAGYSIDFILKKKFYDGPEKIKVSPKVVEIKTELEKTKYLEIIKHSLKRTFRIYAWVVSITLIIGIGLFLLRTENLTSPLHQKQIGWRVGELSIHSSVQIILIGFLGLVPNCGMSVAIAEGFLHAGIGFGATFAGLSSGAGYGPIVLFKDGQTKYAIKVLLLCLFISVAAGFIINFFIPSII